MDVAASYEKLKSVLEQHVPDDPRLKLSSPATRETVAKVIREAPQQLTDFLEVCDYPSSSFFSEIEPVPISQMRNRQLDESRIHYSDTAPNFEGWNRDEYGCCKVDQPWREGWIPIGSIHGDAVFLDMDPAENGIRGQVVQLSIDWWGPEVLGYSIAHWLERVAEQCEKQPLFAGPIPYDDFVELPPPRE